jgi:signal transduction histidine kinase
MRLGLRSKILLLAVAAPVVLAPAALWLVGRNFSTHVRSTVDESLHSAALVCENILESRSRTLQASALILAKDPRFFSALTLPNPDSDHFKTTVRGVARDFNQVAKADLFEVLDSKGRVIVSVGKGASTFQGRKHLISMSRGRAATGILAEETIIYQVTVNPISAGGRVVATLILGSLMDDKLAGELKALTRSEVSFIMGESVVGSTLPSAGDRVMLCKNLLALASSEAGPLQTGVIEVQGTSETYLTLARPIPGANPETTSGYAIQRSLDDQMAFLTRIQHALGQLGLGIALVGMVFGVALTRPVFKLVRCAEEMERGNFDYPLDVRTNDEIGYLANRFLEMRERQRAHVNILEETARLKSELLTITSHELRTPVSIIKAQIEFLTGGKLGKISNEQHDTLRAIEYELEGIGRIIDDAAWLAQTPDQWPILTKTEHDIGDILIEAMRTASADARNRWHRLTVDVEPDVGRAWVDGPRLIHAVANLVRNAVRFTPDGGSVDVRARREDKEIVIEVVDTGIGVAEDKKAHVFDRSFMLRDSLQHHSSRTLEFNSAGLGLGLPLVRGIVEAHGGTITLESQLGEGTIFTIRLPLETSPQGRSEAA